MALVSNAWGVFGAAFGPAILLSLFWRRFTFQGAVAAIVVGAVVDIAWFTFLSSTGIYELLPGFVASLLAGIVGALMSPAPSDKVIALYDEAIKFED